MLSQDASPHPDALFSAIRFAGRDVVVAAVSGGGDSLALLLLLHEYLRGLPESPSLIAVTIDHGLRPESADEARAVGQIAAAYGIDHQVRRWQGPKPATGISAAAREARLSLLSHAAAEAGTDLVLTGHTADDQAETLAMRLARGEGRGTAGIAPATLYDGRTWLVRPLLETRREVLRGFLRGRGIGWLEDPTNKDRRFERARARQDVDEEAIQRLLVMAREAAKTREEAGRRAAISIRAASRVRPGLLRLPLVAIKKAEPDCAVYALRILLAVAGGATHLPGRERVSAILDQIGEEGFRTSLSRAVLVCRRGHIYLHRERRNLPETPVADRLLWDGRYRILAKGRIEGLTVAPFGLENARDRDISGFDAPAGLVRAALGAEPAVWTGGECLGLASEAAHLSLQPVAGPWALLLPSFDLAPARMVGEVLGAEAVPASPWRGHKGSVR